MSDIEQVSSEEDYPEITYEAAKKMTIGVLREEMSKRGLDTKGSKKTLLNRIKYYSGRGFPPTPKPSKSKKICGRKRKLEEDDEEEQVDDGAPAIKKRRLNDSSSKSSDKKEQDVDESDFKLIPEPEPNQQVQTEKQQIEAEEKPKPKPQHVKRPAIVKQATDIQPQQQEIEAQKAEVVMEAVMEANDNDNVVDEDIEIMDVDDSPKEEENKKEEEETQSPDLMIQPQQNAPQIIQQTMPFPSTINNNENIQREIIIGDVEKEEEVKEEQLQVNDDESPFTFTTHQICDKHEMDVDDDDVIPIQEIGGLSVNSVIQNKPQEITLITEIRLQTETETQAEEFTQIPLETEPETEPEAEPEQNGGFHLFVPQMESIQNN